MTQELAVSRKADKVVVKTKGVVVSMMDAEEAITLANELTSQADKILAGTESKHEKRH